MLESRLVVSPECGNRRSPRWSYLYYSNIGRSWHSRPCNYPARRQLILSSQEDIFSIQQDTFPIPTRFRRSGGQKKGLQNKSRLVCCSRISIGRKLGYSRGLPVLMSSPVHHKLKRSWWTETSVGKINVQIHFGNSLKLCF